MAKLLGALLIVFAIELAMFLFVGTSYGQSSLFTVLMNPPILTSSGFYLIFTAILVGASAAVIIIGSAYQINQWALFAVAGISLITFAVHITHFWSFIQLNLTPAVGILWAGYIASFITGPLLLLYIITVVEWSRGNQ